MAVSAKTDVFKLNNLI